MENLEKITKDTEGKFDRKTNDALHAYLLNELKIY